MARKVINDIKKCLNDKKSFLLEAGAGAGKTYTLIKTIEYLQNQETSNYKILCITYTNIAKDEVLNRLKKKSCIIVNTMHEFIWGYINKYQFDLKKEVLKLIEQEKEKLENEIKRDEETIKNPRINTNIEKKEENILENKRKLEKYDNTNFNLVSYENYRALYDGVISHDDVIDIFCEFLKNDLFAQLFIDSFTHIFIDEYQDTNKKILLELLGCLNKYKENKNVVLGLFGDAMQQIYSSDSTEIDYKKFDIKIISKTDNYRSCKEIINVNNVLRMDGLKQEYKSSNINLDKIEFIYNLNRDIYLKEYNDIDIEEYTRLFLTYKEIADELGFKNVSNIFSDQYKQNVNDKLLKMEDDFIRVIIETVIVYINNFNNNNYKDIILRYNNKYFNKKDLEILKGKIQEIIDRNYNLKETIIKLEELNLLNIKKINNIVDSYKRRGKIDFINKLYDVKLDEFNVLYNQIYSKTKVQTLHGVKGDEFDKVIVNIKENQRWSQYNFDNFFKNGLEGKKSSINTHKLLYVACTRAKKALIINYMATNKEEEHIQKIKDNVEKLFGENMKWREYK